MGDSVCTCWHHNEIRWEKLQIPLVSLLLGRCCVCVCIPFFLPLAVLLDGNRLHKEPYALSQSIFLTSRAYIMKYVFQLRTEKNRWCPPIALYRTQSERKKGSNSSNEVNETKQERERAKKKDLCHHSPSDKR